jgi:hypothetical protein
MKQRFSPSLRDCLTMVLAAAGGTGEYVALCQLQYSHRLHFSLSIAAFRTTRSLRMFCAGTTV